MLFIVAAFPGYTHLYEPMEVTLKGYLGFYDKAYKIAYERLEHLKINFKKPSKKRFMPYWW